MDSPGGEIGLYKNVSSASTCMEFCKDNENCSIWTYHEKMCYMKGGKVIRMKAKKRISGTKNCHENGNLRQIS